MSGQSMREALEGAFDESEEEQESEQEEAGGSVEDTEESLGDTEVGEAEGEEAAGEESAGDDSGDSDEAAGTKAGDTKAGEEESGDAEEHDTAEPSSVKAPASWKPAARESWAKIPEGAQKEIARREKHMDNMVRESAESRKHHTEFQALMHPFEPLVAAQNSTPMGAIKNLMTTAAGLTLGSPQQKAKIVTDIMKNYGVDVEVLDQVLAGSMAGTPNQQQPGGIDPNIQHAISQQMAPINQFMGQMNQQRQTYESGQAQTVEGNIAAFAADPANEFFGDVRESMADLMEMSAKRGEEMTMQQAYEKACRMDDSINTIVSGRAAAVNAAANNKSVAKKRHAASSISGGNAAGAGAPAATTLRNALVDAWDDAS